MWIELKYFLLAMKLHSYISYLCFFKKKEHFQKSLLQNSRLLFWRVFSNEFLKSGINALG